MKESLAIMRMDMKRTFKSPKLYLLIIFTIYFLRDFTITIKSLALINNMGVAPYTYPLFYGNWVSRLYAMLVIVILMSDAPFVDSSQKYTYIRTGDGKWLLGKIFYISMLAFLYQFMIVVCSVFLLLPELGMTTEWGDILSTFALESSGGKTGLGGADFLAYITNTYAPIEGMLVTFVLASLVSIMVGIFIFFVNGLTKSMAGTVLALIIGMADMFISSLKDFGYNLKIPNVISWMNPGSVYIENAVIGKTFFGITVATILIVSSLMVTGIYIMIRKKIINVAE